MTTKGYRVEVDGHNLRQAIKELDAIGVSKDDGIRIECIDSKLILTRWLDKHESVQSELDATGYLPLLLRVPWRRFRNLVDEHGALVVFRMDDISSDNGVLKANDMLLPFLVISPQLQLNYISNRAPSTLGPSGSPSINVMICERIREIEKRIIENGPMRLDVLSRVYERDEVLSRLIKRLRGSRCQICGYSFRMTSGEQYSECHHLEHLANNGLDVSRNILILCANHHRQFHYGNVKILSHSIDKVSILLEGIQCICDIGMRDIQ